MRVIADLHIHSCYSRATSRRMHVEETARYANIKGLTIIGTGDFTHPKWLRELKEKLIQESDTSLYRVGREAKSPLFFIVTTEVSTIFSFKNEAKKIHHVILTPSFETASQINARLGKFGDLSIDGRPTLNMNAAQLVEEVMEVSNKNLVFPAHIWTPWFSIFGAFNGFDTVRECYQDMSKYIYALETGLSSDPLMNWRLSKNDKFTLVSNSDSHSFWPWRLGREANVLELKRPNYIEVLDAIRFKDKKRFRFTIETNPAYGKYHWTGHRNCDIALSPKEAINRGNICPVCRKKLTKGVEQRVEELADRQLGSKPEKAIDFIYLLPLSEIIATVLRVASPYTKKVWSVYNSLIKKFGNEYNVLIDTSKEELCAVIDEKISEAIIRVREGNVTVIPGYDGVYGRIVIGDEHTSTEDGRKSQQLGLTDFM